MADAPPVEEPALHPLTLGTAVLPRRTGPGAAADVWADLDRAAAWVYEELGAEQDAVRHVLRLLCVATRATWAAADHADAPPPIHRGDLPSTGPVSAGTLVRALRRRLSEQTVEAHAYGLPAADSADVLRAVYALDRVEAAIEGDGVHQVHDQLTGPSAMALLVELAHDMRSPLGSILFLLERMRGAVGRPGADAAPQLALVHDAAFGLSAMVSDVMELARGGDALATGTAAPFVVGDVLAAVAAVVAPVAAQKGLALRVGAGPAGRRLGHAAAVQRVLLNLVTNALKYTPSGEVVVTVAQRSATRVAFQVRDTGPGIPEAVLAQLFQTFRHRASVGDRAFSSAGLGLAICQKLLHAMRSELAVESAAGQGTTFRFELELPPVA